MERIARVVAVGYPHHVIQRGNRRQPTFFCDEDYIAYLDLMSHWCAKHKVEIWAYCLMENHVHLIAVPTKTEESLRLAIGEAHRRYTRMINFREKWRGHLWQERFHSFPMDEFHLIAAARYVEQNPVRAKLVSKASDYPWSSAAAHLSGQDDRLVFVKPLLDLVQDWQEYIGEEIPEKTKEKLKLHEQTGRPLGSKAFIEMLEKSLDRILRPLKPWETKTKE